MHPRHVSALVGAVGLLAVPAAPAAAPARVGGGERCTIALPNPFGWDVEGNVQVRS